MRSVRLQNSSSTAATTAPITSTWATEGLPSATCLAVRSVLAPQSNTMWQLFRSTQNQPSGRCVATATYPR